MTTPQTTIIPTLLDGWQYDIHVKGFRFSTSSQFIAASLEHCPLTGSGYAIVYLDKDLHVIDARDPNGATLIYIGPKRVYVPVFKQSAEVMQ